MSPEPGSERAALPLQVGVLGPLVLRVDGRSVEVPGMRRRALLALLALEAGHTVGVEQLVDRLWPEDQPENATQALYSHVSRLRGHLGAYADRLGRTAGGYRLVLEPGELDADAARRLAARVTRPDTPAAEVAALAREALALWRGPALGEFAALPSLEPASVPLEELRLRLHDDLVDAALRVAEPGVAELAALAAAASPLRERTALLHVRALAADGRTREAMAAAQAFRRRLAEETGLDPGPALDDLEQQVASGALEPAGPGGGRRPRAHVPRPDGPLLGRREDRAEVLRLLGGHAVVTVTGPGGVGKTRLALDVVADPEALQDGSEGVVLVDLGAVDRADRVCAAVASTLGLRTRGDVAAGDVAGALVDRSLLLLLDNCEHVVDACRELVVTLRRAAPGVHVLATSRVTLHVPGEYVVRLQPLPVPRDPTDLASLQRQPVVRAFLEHARARRPDLELREEDVPDLLEVVRRLDGLPLGIELAARQVAVMPLRAVRERLDRALDLATGPRGPGDRRQQTLRATIAASYRLLDEEGRALLRALAVFPGGADVATVEALVGHEAGAGDPVDVLHGLVDASLVVVDAETGRYRLLFTVRAFLLDELRATDALAAAEERFLDRCLAVAEELGAALLGPREADADRRLRAELDNLRAARDLAATRGRDDVRIGITVWLNDVTIWRDLREMWAWAVDLAEDASLAGHPSRPALLGCAADAARLVGDLDGALRWARAALDAAGPDPAPTLVLRAWSAQASVAHFRGDFVRARDRWLRAGEVETAEAGGFLASAALASAYAGDIPRARAILDRAHDANARGGSVSMAAFAAYVEGELRAAADPAAAVPHYLEAIEGGARVGATFVEGVARVALASARTRTGDVAGAADGFAYLLDAWRRTGQETQLWTTARNAAGLLAAAGRSEAAARLLICADAAPGAATVGHEIARHSGRVYVPVTDVVDGATLERLREETWRVGPGEVLDRATAELRDVAAGAQGAVALPR
ncbi:BTAD domain-containing putative transcriptional regulator [Nocardioides euryhalodurans]|uniref:ATPase n=1 Tax=Nocardioides euryhalodurans TaxID=2518370 RepID=A0A4P7GHB3_9ACTN|nr:BTAD domain-containing putative transcriptional regulator [Nocardioides euryhalodurans]QBR91153.1 ATPase [Nocardioides euryhalodurans]